jgi:hypothetical protein
MQVIGRNRCIEGAFLFQSDLASATRAIKEESLMRKTLLASIAAAALVAGTIAVSAQGMQGGSGGAPSAAPAEKMDRGGAPSGGRSPSGERSTTGQGTQMDRGSSQSQPGAGTTPAERGQPSQTQRDQAQPPRTGQGQTQQAPTGAQRQAPTGAQQQQTGQPSTGATSATLSTEQRTRIRESVLRGGNVNRVSNVNFNIRVGTVVPRSVHLVAVPPTIVEVHPAWRGFLYFVVNDEIIIVEPGTLRIVAVIT